MSDGSPMGLFDEAHALGIETSTKYDEDLKVNRNSGGMITMTVPSVRVGYDKDVEVMNTVFTARFVSRNYEETVAINMVCKVMQFVKNVRPFL